MKKSIKTTNPIAQLVRQARYHQRVVKDKKKEANKTAARRWNMKLEK